MSESASTPLPPPDASEPITAGEAEEEGSPKAIPSSTELTPAPPEVNQDDTPSQQEEQQQKESSSSSNNEPVIDPELMDLPAPPHHNNNNNNGDNTQHTNGTSQEEGEKEYMTTTMGIRDSILSAPNPRPAEFPPPDQLQNNENLLLDLDAIAQIAADNDDMPGSPTAKMMRAIAPPSAIMTNPEWPPPPPNASVNLFIGRALLSNGNDNWPLKPNDIVNWIRKHYPAEWDGDEGRCSAHRVRTYLARKGTDMYYEKLNQGCINGWRIRANHLWRFDNGGFQGRGMKQEESIANAQKEQEALANAARKEAAAAALAAGHPGIKVSMSNPGINDGSLPPPKKPRISNNISSVISNTGSAISTTATAGKSTQPTRRRNNKKASLLQQQQAQQQQQQQQIDNSLSSYTNPNDTSTTGDLSMLSQNQSPYYSTSQHQQNTNDIYAHLDPSQTQAGPSTLPLGHTHTLSGISQPQSQEIDQQQQQQQQQQHNLDPSLSESLDLSSAGVGAGGEIDDNNVDINMVQQAMQAAATQMDDLEMGIQLPIEMQMHSNGHENDDDSRFNFVVGVDGTENGGSYTQQGNYGYTG